MRLRENASRILQLLKQLKIRITQGKLTPMKSRIEIMLRALVIVIYMYVEHFMKLMLGHVLTSSTFDSDWVWIPSVFNYTMKLL